MKIRLYVVLLACFISAHPAVAQEIPKWEFGLGVGGARIPHYRGSDQHEDYLIPLPYIRYNGDRLKVDREGGRFFFYETESTKLDLSMAFAPPVDSEDNQARSGMPDLDPVIEIGPRFQYTVYETADKNLRMRLATPIRAAIATDLGNSEGIGVVFSPYFQVRYYNGAESAVSIGPIWATEDYHDYFYQVDSQYVTASRPAYNARGGYSGARITFSTSYRHKKIWYGLFARYDNISGAVFEDSPLIRQKDTFTVGFGIAYVFAESDEKVSVFQH